MDIESYVFGRAETEIERENFYRSRSVFAKLRGTVIVMVLTFPIVIAGTFAILFNTRHADGRVALRADRRGAAQQ